MSLPCLTTQFLHYLWSRVFLTQNLSFLTDVGFVSYGTMLCCSSKQPLHLSGLKQQRSISYSCYVSPKDPGWRSRCLLEQCQLPCQKEERTLPSLVLAIKYSAPGQGLELDTWVSPTSREPKVQSVTQTYFPYSGGGKSEMFSEQQGSNFIF